jgi:hypothetical protein
MQIDKVSKNVFGISVDHEAANTLILLTYMI